LGVNNYENMKISGEIPFLKKYFSDRNKNFTIFDIGAHVGGYSKIITEINPNTKIYAFEPHPKAFEVLKNNLKNNKITFVNMAISDFDGKASLYDYNISTASSHANLHQGAIEKIYQSQSVVSAEVNVTTLDEYIYSHKIDNIDLLKIDTEGSEIDVLRGASKSMEKDMIDVIQFEFTQMNSTTGILFKDFFNLLVPQYSLFRILPKGLLPIKEYSLTIHEIYGFQNFLAVRNNSDGINLYK